MPLTRRNRADNAAIRTVARIPTHILVSIVIVLLSAGGFVAARSAGPDRSNAGAADVGETPLPTPVSLETGTPLPTPFPAMSQDVVVDTAVTFWGSMLPTDVEEAFDEIADRADRSSDSRGPASEATPTPPPATDGSVPGLPVPVAPPVAVPTAVPLPVPPLPVPVPTLPALLP